MRRVAMLLLLATLGGCSLEPAYQRPVAAIPATWPTGAAYPTPAGGPTLSYRDAFRDPRLQAVIGEALANAQDLRIALANVEIAHGELTVQRAALVPHIDATAAAAENHGADGTTRSYQAGVGFTAFELDLFGRLRSLSHAAQDQYLASEAGVRAARLTLVGEVAQAYLTLAADRSLLAIAEDTEASAGRTVELTQAKLTGGVSARTDLAQAQTLLQQARADRAQLVTNVAQDRNALELLTGAPVPDADLPASLESVDGLLAEAPAGVSSDVLLRRPDVMEAEYELKAANAQIGAARAAFFPTISLTAAAGAASPQLSALFGRAGTWQAGGSLVQSLFAGGANKGNLAQAKGQRDLAVAEYEKAVQTAFREVADALARRGTIKDQMTAATGLTAAANDAYGLALARYQAGVDPYLVTLDAQRTLYGARQTLVATRLAQATNLAALYQALGGDERVG